MAKRRWAKALFIIGTVIALLCGNRLNRTVIASLGGSYSLLTEFGSDAAAMLYHKFNSFRDFSIIAAFICAVLLWLMISHVYKTLICTGAILAVYTVCCFVYYFCFLASPSAIALFIVKRALCSSFIIFVPILLYDKPLT